MVTLLLFLAVLSLLVFAHELGHFFTARRLGMTVEEFGFGFPPRLFGFKRGETVYSVNAIPMGGFVKIKGETGTASAEPDSFQSQSAWKRAIVLAAGVFMNVVLAAVLLSIGFLIGLPTAVDGPLPPSAHFSDQAIQIVSVLPGSPAASVHLRPGDKLLSIGGQNFETTDEARVFIQDHSQETLDLVLGRGKGETFSVSVRPALLSGTQTVGLGVGLVKTALVSYPFPLALWKGGVATVRSVGDVVVGFGQVLRNLVTRGGLSSDLSGPVGIAVMTGEAASLGLRYLLQFTALLSINLAVINLVPFPALDGGRLLFLALEKGRRRPVSPRLEAWVHQAGFLFLLVVVLLVTFRDLARFGGTIVGALRNLVGA
ncbi:MAG TPA: site-2 protease family protein [Patescibacteria group bacterium]|nr:site-2 protease family protein [Patescibacteria group bacterium]